MTKENSKVWFITGASSGFEKAMTQYAVSQGHRVVATARRQEKLESLAKTAPEQIFPISMDVTKREEVKRAVKKAIDKYHSIDILINNAGYGIVGALEETPEAAFRNQMETNFFGAITVTQEVLPQLRKQKNGAIVNMSSMGGNMSFGGFSAYSASKFALEGASEALAQEVAPFGITTMIVEPGAFRTEFAGSALKHMPKIEAYDEIVGGTRDFAKKMDGTQEGDPLKAAKAIYIALQADKPTLRLQLGEDAINAVKEHAEVLIKKLEEWRETGENTRLEKKVM